MNASAGEVWLLRQEAGPEAGFEDELQLTAEAESVFEKLSDQHGA